MLCPSRDSKTQEPSLKRIEDIEGLLAILRTNSLNIKHGLRSAVRHVLMLRGPNVFSPAICPTRKSVLNTLNDPDEEIYDQEICKLPIIRFPFPYNPQMPEPNRLIL